MSSFTRFLVSATIWLFSIWKSALLIFILLLSAHFIYKQTTLRVVPTPKTGENLSSKVHSSVGKAKIIPKAFTDIGKKKITKKESSKKLTNSTLREEPSDNKEISKGSVFSDFSNWIKEYQTFACSKPLNCLDHDPRLASSLVLRGKKIARARRKVMASLISNNPQKAIELAIPQEVIKSLPHNITENLEKWQSGLIDVNTWHACSSQNHKLCKIEHRVTFNEDEHFEMYTYGQRKNLPSVKGLSAWGISLGNKFAMSDQAVLELSTNNMGGGELIFAGNKLSYDSPVEKNFFVELVQQAENRGRRSGGKLFYPISMGSNGTVQGYLREKYEIFFSEKEFLNITDQMPRHDDRSYPEYPTGNELTWGSWGAMSNLHFAGDTERPGRKLLQIESQAENDYIVYLINQHFGHIPSPTTGHIPSPTKIWIGLTKDKDQVTTVYDRKNNLYRDVNLTSWGADGSNWFWLDGSEIGYSNWNTSPPDPSFDHVVLDSVTGKWETANGSDTFPYILEKNLPFEIGSIPSNLSGTRKILVVPARFEDQTTKMRSATDAFSDWKLERNHLITNEFGEIINEDVYTEPYEPISRANLEAVMREVVDYYKRNTDQRLNLIPIIAPTVTIPWRIRDFVYSNGEHHGDTSGSETGPIPVDYDKGNPVLDFAELAMIEAGKQSEEWDFYGPAFTGVTEIKLNVPVGSYTSSSLPLITLSDGAFLKPETLLPHPRFKAAELEPILNEDGNLTAIRIVDTGSYYFDPNFGSRWDSGGRSIFDYNYTTDDLETDPLRRSALYEYRDLCQKLDLDDDGVADYDPNTVEPTLMVDGVPLSTSYSVEINNVCLTWVGLTNYELEEDGLAWYGAPGAHVLIRDGNISSRTLVHEIGHNFGLMHAQRYESKGEQALSDEGVKVPYGNPYSVMGSAPSIINGSGDLTIAEKLFFFDLYDGQAGYTPGLMLNSGVDILDLNNASDLSTTDMQEQDPLGISNKFRIYRSNSPGPPLSLREANYSIKFPPELNDTVEGNQFTDILRMLDEYFGEANYTNNSSAHDLNQTASDLNKSIRLLVVGTGENAEANLVFSPSGNPTLQITNGGRGFLKVPTFKILEEDNKTEFLTIDRSWIRELSPNDHLQARLFDNNLTDRWIRGVRINADNLENGPKGLDVSQVLNRYYLSYRTDISSKGLVLLASNNPDINNSYTQPYEYFNTQNEAFLLDATPHTPNNFKDAALLIGVTYSDHHSDIHITPTAFGGGGNFDLLKEEIDVQRELVQALQFTNEEERENTLSLEAAFSTARGEFSSYQTQVEEQQKVISDYIDLELEGTQLYEEAVEQLAYLQALLTLSETAFSSAEAALEASFFSLEESDLKLNTEVTKFNELTKELQTEQEGLYPYIEFVVNIGTIGNGNATAPDFELHSSSLTPSIGERVTLRALVVDGNTSAYAYSWYINESQFDEPGQLNQPVISTVFAQSGHYVVRVVVSDMKGGISSKNLVLSVGDVEQKNMSLVTGTVRSKDGFLQGARVVIEEAPVVTHDFSMSGNLRDSFYPSGDGNPATFFVDGQVAPELTFHRGEVHRFYFDKSLEDYNVSFLEKPENNPPRIKIHMLTDPRVSLSGNAYYRNPDVNFTTRSAFSSHLSTKIGTYLEMLEYLQEHNQSNGIGQPLVDLNETDSNDSDYLDLLEYLKDNNISITRFNDINGTRKANEVMNPYPKALLSESNVTKGIVGPTFANELGYITFGGRGYDRNDTPRVDVRRSSIWEDYNSTNAVAIANVDGVGTISPVNAVTPHEFLIDVNDIDFLGSSWALRNESASREVTIPDNEDDPTLQLGSTTSLPAVPDLVVWGSGGGHADDPLSEVNASVSAWKSGDNNIRTINIFNQGKGFEPNSTMAVLHYPRDPFAYWSFDRHETLFEDRNHSRHQPSPAWNRELSGIGDRLTHYWKMDDEVNSTTSLLNNETNGTAFLNLDPGLDAQSTWGLLGRAIKLNGNQDLNASNVLPEGNFTLSFWSNLQDDLNITVGGLPLNYNFTDKKAELGGSGGLSKIREDIFNEWMHIAVTFDENASLYVDGRKESAVFIPSDRDLTISNLNGLLDEIKIYDVVLSEPQVRYLSGRNFLDLSGNKYHAVPVGSGFIPVSPEAVADVPEEFSYPNTPVIGTQIMSLGDSFPGEDHGRSLSFDGVDDHLDLSSHLLDFGLPEGTICMWVKTTTSQTAPLLWISSPLEITSFEIPDQNTSETLITPGNFFAFEIANGMPRLGGITAFDQNNKVNDDEWHHVAASFPSGNIWVDGARVDIATYGTEDVLFSGTQSPLDFIVNADQFYIGKAPDRTQPNEEILFNGRLDDVIFYDRILTNDEVYYLYELRRGREQIPRLEAIVDAIGTVEIIDGGSGYRENPDLVFWYGENNETPNDLPAVATDNDLPASTSQGSLTFVTDEAQVYSYHEGKASFRDYKWRMGTNNDNGWRKHVAAAGIVEFGDPDSLLPNLEDIVWTQKLDFVTWIPLPDGRWDKRLYVDYVTMDRNLSSSSVINKSHSHPYFKPNGLGGFVERPDFAVASPEEHNPDALAAYAATAYGLFFVDHDQNDSLTIVDGGSGFDVPDVGFDLTSTFGEPFSILQFKVRGKSYQPEQYLRHTHTYAWDGIFLDPYGTGLLLGSDYTLLAEEDWNNTTWNDVYFGTGWSSLKYGGLHISNDPKNSFIGPYWEQNLQGTNRLFDEVTVQTIDNTNPNGPYPITGLTIDADQTDLNKTIGSVSVDASGYGYSMPIELRVVGGRPMFDDRIPTMPFGDLAPFEAALGKQYFEIYANSDSVPNDIARGAYTFKDAEFNVTQIDSNGSILHVDILDGGSGYIPFYKLPKTDPYAETSFSFDTDNEFRANDKWYSAPNPPFDFHLNEFPFVSVSGGGGYGARIRITKIDITTGEILELNVTNRGRGYFNIDPQNKPVATLDAVAGPGGRDANLSVRLGGSLKEIPPCTGCSSKIHTDSEYDYSHLEPWIEIWDRGRSETTIDDLDASRPTGFPRVRAHAAPKVVDGRITKVVVINSGTGYIDPVAIVRDAPPKHHQYNVKPGVFSRNWVCTFTRTNQDGEEVACGHISNSMYPPDYCPGETDDTLPYEDENGSLYIATGDEIEAWRQRHNAAHKDCADETENLDHLNVTFISRKCWGTKMNYKLLNPIYRLDGDPDKNQTWGPLDAKLSVVSEGGRILRIEVMKEGRDYFASKLYVEGSGTGVDAIPVFNEFGVNTHVIFDDPRLTNDELDKLDYRSGAGQGFRERPWSWDNAHDSGFGGREKVKVYAWHSEVITDQGGLSHAAWDWNFGDPILNDNLGDRVVSIDILDPGLYASDFNNSGSDDFNVPGVKIDYNATVTFHDSSGNSFTKDMNASDHDGDGYADFSPAQVTTHGTYTITHTLLNHDSVMDFPSIFPELGVFSETPVLEFHDERNLNGWLLGTDYVEETSSDFIRLNQKVSYDPEREQSYIELYVDDRFPNQLYYGLDLVEDATSRTLPRFGNLITVTEGLPGMNWATNEPATKAKYSYTDADGFYALPQLESGFYNVSVFMEDQKLQESSFRPDANISRISQILYLPGFPQLTLETDQHGAGRSSLVWAPAARRLSRPAENLSTREEFDQEYRVLKQLEGIGRGFDPDPSSPPPELTFVPDPNNVGITPPNIEVKVLVDGSLLLRIIDDENTSKYFPQDKFYVFHNSEISGVDFVETYLYSESNQTFASGTKAESTTGGILILSPNDGNGANPISAPVSTFEREWNQTSLSWEYLFKERPIQLRAIAYDENRTSVSTASVQWSAYLDFNSSEGNNSRIIQLEDENGTRGQEANGSAVNAYLFSLLRKGWVEDLNITHGGENYTEGSLVRLSGNGDGFLARVSEVNASTGAIENVEILSHGENYSQSAVPYVVDKEGSGAILQPQLPYSGTVRIEANMTIPGESNSTIKSILLKPSLKYPLDSLESWRNRFTDSFWSDATDPNWLQTYLTEDNDTDGLTNEEEWSANTNPLSSDSDGDGLPDVNETQYFTNPWLPDTDGDGLTDSFELNVTTPSNPLKYDTDKDGLSDGDDPDPLNSDGNGIISGIVVKSPMYDSNATVYFYCFSPDEPFTDKKWDSNWTDRMNNFYLTGKTAGNYTIRSFIDFQPQDGEYQYGEPYAEQNITLSAQSMEAMGRYLVPLDLAPEIKFYSPPGEGNFTQNSDFERNVTIDINDTNLIIDSFAYAVQAVDPYDKNRTLPAGVMWITDVNASFELGNPVNNVEFLVDGNFTPYMDFNQSRSDFNSTVKFDLDNTPVGKYYLSFRAVDSYGNISPAIIKNIEIRDTQPPYISLLDLENQKGATTFSETELKTIIEDVTFDINETNNSVVWQWPYGEPFQLVDLSNTDSINGMVIVHVLDTKNDVITDWEANYSYSDSNVSPELSANQIEDLNLSYVISDENNTNKIGTHKIIFVASDRSGNPLDFTLYLLVKPGYQSTITAVDGYLENAIVGFDADGDGVSDLDSDFRTNSSGKAEVLFTAAEFAKFDLNGNGKLDANEGNFIVLGGIDTSTGTVFSGKLFADASASVVSPLTTLISQMMVGGLSKEEAMKRVSLALGLDEGLDLTNYDPIQKAFEGEANATLVMMANLRIANLVNQSEGLLRALSEEYEGYEVGTDLLEEIAHWISTQKVPGLLDMEDALVDAIPVALASVGTVGELSIEDQLTMFQLMTDSDIQFTTFEEDMSFDELMTQQIAFIEDLDKLVQDLSDELSTTKLHYLTLEPSEGGKVYGGEKNHPYGSEVEIVAQAEENFKFIEWRGEGIEDSKAATTNVLMVEDRNITALFERISSEEYTQSDRNLDEEDGSDLPEKEDSANLYYLALEPSEGGKVYGGGNHPSGSEVEIVAQAEENFKFVEWRGEGIEDSKAATTNVNMVEDRNITALFERISSEEESGSQGEAFYYYLSSEDLSDGKNLFTLQTPQGSMATFFEISSGNLDMDEDGQKLFELSSFGDFKLNDLDEVKKLAGSKVSLSVLVGNPSGKTSEILGNVEFAHELFLMSKSLGNSWYSSPWLGIFMKNKLDSSWVFHYPLGWVYIHPSQNNSYWLWPEKLDEWLWTNENLFPQTYSASSLTWLYFHIDNENIRIFDYDQQSWEILP